jgi:hypothetical protein
MSPRIDHITILHGWRGWGRGGNGNLGHNIHEQRVFLDRRCYVCETLLVLDFIRSCPYLTPRRMLENLPPDCYQACSPTSISLVRHRMAAYFLYFHHSLLLFNLDAPPTVLQAHHWYIWFIFFPRSSLSQPPSNPWCMRSTTSTRGLTSKPSVWFHLSGIRYLKCMPIVHNSCFWTKACRTSSYDNIGHFARVSRQMNQQLLLGTPRPWASSCPFSDLVIAYS